MDTVQVGQSTAMRSLGISARFVHSEPWVNPEWTASRMSQFSAFIRLIAAGRISCFDDEVPSPSEALPDLLRASKEVGDEVEERFRQFRPIDFRGLRVWPQPAFSAGQMALDAYFASVDSPARSGSIELFTTHRGIATGLPAAHPRVLRVKQGSPLNIDVILPAVLGTSGGIATIVALANRAHKDAIEIRNRHREQAVEDARRDRHLVEERVRLEAAISQLGAARYEFPSPASLEFWDVDQGPRDDTDVSTPPSVTP